MTSESKENLLKILLDEAQEQEGAVNTQAQIVTNDGTRASNYKQREYYTYNGYTIIVTTDSKVLIIDSEFNAVFEDYLYINNQAFWIESLSMDNEGLFYCYAKNQSSAFDQRLVYLNNITEPVAEGTYKLIARKSYKLGEVWTAIGQYITAGQQGSGTFYYPVSFKIIKSPYDSRFIILGGSVTNNISEYDLFIVSYKVNFGYGENEYDFRITSISDYTYVQIKSAFASFTDDNVQVGVCCLNTNIDFTTTTPAGISYYYAYTDFSENSEITTKKILAEDNFVSTMPNIYGGFTLQTDLSTIYIPINHKDTTTGKIDLKIYRFNSRTTKKIYEYNCTLATAGAICYSMPLLVNNQVFFGILALNDQSAYMVYTHIIKDSIDLIEINTYFTGTYWNRALINNTYDLYNFYMSEYIGTFVFRTDDYNGNAYFNDTSLVSSSSKLYTSNSSNITYPIFARSLYDRVQGGNTINSTTQIPYNMLNGTPITQEDLLSKTNTTISSDNKEISKNEYEELYINNIDTFKVYDENIGSTYNQNASIQIAQNVYNGFTDNYKIKKYKINYNDGTTKNYNISQIVRNGNEAIITIGVYNTGIQSIQLYDEQFTTPFITIDMTDKELNKLYVINQSVIVE